MFRKNKNINYGKGSAYDLIFAVNIFDPNLNSTVNISPYVIDSTLYIQCDKIPENEGTVSTSVVMYRYNSKDGTAEQIVLPTQAELQKITERQNLVLSTTKNLKLNTNEKSPDGFVLAEPGWVKVNPISNVLGNLILFLYSGKFQDILERENFPRLARGTTSILLKSRNKILKNEADNAYLIGWVVPRGSTKK